MHASRWMDGWKKERIQLAKYLEILLILNEEDKEEKKINIRRAYSTSITSSLTVFSMFFFRRREHKKKKNVLYSMNMNFAFGGRIEMRMMMMMIVDTESFGEINGIDRKKRQRRKINGWKLYWPRTCIANRIIYSVLGKKQRRSLLIILFLL